MNNSREKVWRAINPDRLRKTLFDLIDIYSPLHTTPVQTENSSRLIQGART